MAVASAPTRDARFAIGDGIINQKFKAALIAEPASARARCRAAHVEVRSGRQSISVIGRGVANKWIARSEFGRRSLRTKTRCSIGIAQVQAVASCVVC